MRDQYAGLLPKLQLAVLYSNVERAQRNVNQCHWALTGAASGELPFGPATSFPFVDRLPFLSERLQALEPVRCWDDLCIARLFERKS